MQVLYIEDNAGDVEITQRTLRRLAPWINLDIASNLQEAYALIGENTYTAALVDLQLPDGRGTEFINHIRAKSLPLTLIVLTGIDDEAITVTALKAGADDYLVKWGDYLQRLPRLLAEAVTQRANTLVERNYRLRVLYVEHFSADVELTQRHFTEFAPYIHLDILRNGNELLQILEQGTHYQDVCDVLMLDYRLHGLNGLELLKRVKTQYGTDIPVIIITGQGSVDIALQALKLGAFDYIVKQEGYLHKLPSMLENAFHMAELERDRTALTQSLADKELLMQELFHRTRNNMQVISSIIELQAMQVTDPSIKNICLQTKQRVNTMSMVQQLLYESHQLSTVRLDTYLLQLASELQRLQQVPEDQVKLVFDLEEIEALIDNAVPCGLIFNELLMNAYQHAFPDSNSGTVEIILKRAGEHRLLLEVRDNGVGVAPDFDFRQVKSLGLQAVVMIAEFQLQGQVSVDTQNGFGCQVIVRDDLYQARV